MFACFLVQWCCDPRHGVQLASSIAHAAAGGYGGDMGTQAKGRCRRNHIFITCVNNYFTAVLCTQIRFLDSECHHFFKSLYLLVYTEVPRLLI